MSVAPRVLCVGESMVLLAPPPGVRLDLAEQAALRVAGAESNTAQYLADLGHATAWASRVGADPLGDKVVASIRDSGVDTRWVLRDPQAPTGVFFKDPDGEQTEVFYYRSDSAATRLSPDDLDQVDFARLDVVHVTGITPALSSSCAATVQAVFERAAAAGALRSFDVNYRPRLWEPDTAPSALHDLAARADVVFVGLDEAAQLWDTHTPEQLRHMFGRTRLVVKDAAIGATLFESTRRWFVPAQPVDVVEPVGAGDAFAAGFLSGLLRSKAPEECLRLGHRVAGLALGTIGDHVDASALRHDAEVFP